jgi:hypothetical protein
MSDVAPRTTSGERYVTQMGELWSGLSRTLGRLDRIAGEPRSLEDGETLDVLQRLQYRLHMAGERVYGLAPPAGAEAAHRELWASLAVARDATADVVEALTEDGPETAGLLVHEWRGALFGVRLARLRLLGPRRPEEPAEPPPARRFTMPFVACVLVTAGAGAFVLGATTGRWPLWLAGMLAVCGAALGYRP